jgi:hypothetical protein
MLTVHSDFVSLLQVYRKSIYGFSQPLQVPVVDTRERQATEPSSFKVAPPAGATADPQPTATSTGTTSTWVVRCVDRELEHSQSESALLCQFFQRSGQGQSDSDSRVPSKDEVALASEGAFARSVSAKTVLEAEYPSEYPMYSTRQSIRQRARSPIAHRSSVGSVWA